MSCPLDIDSMFSHADGAFVRKGPSKMSYIKAMHECSRRGMTLTNTSLVNQDALLHWRTGLSKEIHMRAVKKTGHTN